MPPSSVAPSSGSSRRPHPKTRPRQWHNLLKGCGPSLPRRDNNWMSPRPERRDLPFANLSGRLSNREGGATRKAKQPGKGSRMDISDWRTKIDALDLQIVELLNQRAEAARAIGV